jgi:hypothetical protein
MLEIQNTIQRVAMKLVDMKLEPTYQNIEIAFKKLIEQENQLVNQFENNVKFRAQFSKEINALIA